MRQAAGRSRRDESFGVYFDRQPGGTFEYAAASRPWAGAAPPLELLTLSAGRYLVFRHRLRGGAMLPQLTAAQESIVRVRQRIGATWDFQYYPENFGAAERRWIDHYLPLADAGRAPVRRACRRCDD